jgi:hypothetical protein
MLILFDNGTPAPLRYALKDHVVVEAIERGWDRLANGELIEAAEAAGFELLLTTDKNMRYQQNLTGRKIAFVVLGNQQWPILRLYVERVVAAVNVATPGEAISYLRDVRGFQMVVRYRPSADRKRDEYLTVRNLQTSGVRLLNDLVGYNYRQADKLDERDAIYKFCEVLLRFASADSSL